MSKDDKVIRRQERARTLFEQGKYVEAETEFRAVIKLQEKTLGAGDSDTLASRYDLAVTLRNEGKNAEADAEFRAVRRLREKLLDPTQAIAPLTKSAGDTTSSTAPAVPSLAEAKSSETIPDANKRNGQDQGAPSEDEQATIKRQLSKETDPAAASVRPAAESEMQRPDETTKKTELRPQELPTLGSPSP